MTLNRDLLNEIKAAISEKIDLKRYFTDEEILGVIEKSVFEKSREIFLKSYEKKDLISAVFNSLRRLDILQPILDDSDITEIMINGPNSLFIEKFGRSTRLNMQFESAQKLEDIIQIMVTAVNRTVNESTPIVDARLKDGSRINVVLPPIALDGPIVTIRKFPSKPVDMERLIELESVTPEAAEALKKLVLAKYNIFICGGTGSGKTTFLNALSNFIPQDERIITIEDSAELQIQNIPNLVRLETRNSNLEGRGEITIRDLIKTSLRMKPTRIIVGEVRGTETIDMLQAMNTGHDGSLSTGHANSTEDMLSRLETMVLSSSPLPLEAVRKQISSAIDIIIFLSRLRDSSRRTIEISEVLGLENGHIQLNPLFTFEEASNDMAFTDKVEGCLKRSSNPLINTRKLRNSGIACDI
ncbi:putative conjugal transfer proteinc [Ruminiclostridium hungatei]|uniref:Putative conjugal transfer proteinc n=1 Tax=Ruminiclostridium hungatei TaxID=48256 RepID=A0A1V4SR62_RUMHU|nr:CpaF family protein [Ruminiclostridium hungatei]OPX46273.1 putative conjugal transfer proteinc [Ruminiclostridium hungatei]